MKQLSIRAGYLHPWLGIKHHPFWTGKEQLRAIQPQKKVSGSHKGMSASQKIYIGKVYKRKAQGDLMTPYNGYNLLQKYTMAQAFLLLI